MLEVLFKIIVNLFDVRMRVSEDECASTGEGVFASVLKVVIILLIVIGAGVWVFKSMAR